MEKNSPSFRAVFTEAYSLRNLITIINKKIDKASLIIKPDGIQICQDDSRDTMLIYAEISAADLIHYYYNVNKPYLVIGFQTSEFIRALKILKKKDGARIEYKGKNDPYVYIYTLNSSSKGCDSGCGKIRVIDVDDIESTIPTYKNIHPTVKEEGIEFSSLCSALISHKCHYVIAHCCKNSIEFAGHSAEKLVVYNKKFGKSYPDENTVTYIPTNEDEDEIKNLDESEDLIQQNSTNDEDEDFLISIPIDNFKCLQKINNLSNNSSIIKIYAEKNVPLCISTSIGGYGTFNVYLSNNKSYVN